MAIVLAGALAICTPYLIFKALDLRLVLSRVPEPLHVSWIEYRLEDHPGIGGPGDEETGFAIYRLTKESADWARSQGSNLGDYLPGGSTKWRSTPVDDKTAASKWHYDHAAPQRFHQVNIREYLQQYGGIPLEHGVEAEANDAIRSPGSFYSYGGGGSVTIVDPKRGKVYFAFAG